MDEKYAFQDFRNTFLEEKTGPELEPDIEAGYPAGTGFSRISGRFLIHNLIWLRYSSLFGCDTAPYLVAIQLLIWLRYSSLFGCDTAPYLVAIQLLIWLRYSSLFGCDTANHYHVVVFFLIHFSCSLFMIFVIWLFKKYMFFSQRLILYLAIAALFDSVPYMMGSIDNLLGCKVQVW